MPIHPAPPHDLSGMIEAYERGAQAVVDLASSCTPAHFTLPTACPGWSLHDQLSHIAAVESHLAGLPEPHHEGVHTSADLTELGVLRRRSQSSAEVIRDIEELISLRVSHLRHPTHTLDTPVRFLTTTLPLGELLTLRICDIWCHEQDIRAALKRPGNLDAPGAILFTQRIFDRLPELLLDAAIEPGHTVLIDVTGPVVARGGARVTTSDPSDAPDAVRRDGRTAHPLFEGTDTAELADVSTATRIQLNTDTLTRRAAGRVSTANTHVGVVGSHEVARRVLDHLVITFQ